MASLEGQTLTSTYTSILKLEPNEPTLVVGGNTALRVKTGDDQITPLYLNTDRVGIGTASPATILHVSGGDIRLDSGKDIEFGGDATKILGDSTVLQFYCNSAEAMRIDSAGKVGIGVTNPGANLEIADSSAATLRLDDTGYGYFEITQDGGKLAFTAETLGTLMTIDGRVSPGTGNVGIGKSSPGNKLEVDGNIKLFQATDALASGIIIENAAANNSSYIYQDDTSLKLFTNADNGITILDSGSVTIPSGDLGLSDGNITIAATKLLRFDGGDDTYMDEVSANKLRFHVGGANAMYIDSGKVGIGVDDPDQSLEVAGNIHISDGGMLQISDTSGTDQRIHFDGSTDWSIGQRNSVNKFQISKNSGLDTVYLTIDTAGSVGIGTDAPSTMDAEANNLVVGSGSADEGITIYSGQNVGDFGSIFFADGVDSGSKKGQIRYEQNTEAMTFWTNSTQRLTIDIDGKVGIGASPAVPLHVSTSENQVARFESTDAYAGIELKDTGSATLPPLISGLSNDLILYGGHADTRPEIMRLLANGNVGIGHDSPSSPLHIKCNANDYGLTLEDSDEGSNETFSLKMDGGGHLQFEAGTSGDLDNKGTIMTIKDDGKVGIGETAPDELLHIKSSSGDARITLEAPASSDAEIKFYEDSAIRYTIGYDDGTGNFVIGHDNVDAPWMSIDSAGKVGIGATTPTDTLHVKTGDSNSGIRMENPDAGGESYKFSISDDGGTAYGAAGTFSIRDVSNNVRLAIAKTTGNIGIGTTAPQSELHVKGAGGNILRLEATEATNSPYIEFFDNAARKGVIGYGGYGDSDSISIHNEENSDIRFGTNDTFAMIIDQAQCVGINEAAPATYGKLTVKAGGADNMPAATLWSQDTGELALKAWKSGLDHSTGTVSDVINILGSYDDSPDGSTGIGLSWTMKAEDSGYSAVMGRIASVSRSGIIGSSGAGFGADLEFHTMRNGTLTKMLALSGNDDKNEVQISNTVTVTSGSTQAVNVDVNKTGITADGEQTTLHGMLIDVDDTATNHSGSTTVLTGLKVDITGNSNGSTTNYGVYSTVASADTNYAGVFIGGNVGIGDTTPIAKLQVHSDEGTAFDATDTSAQSTSGGTLLVSNNNTATDSFAQIALFASESSGRVLGRIACEKTASGSSALAFVTEGSDSPSEKMRILGDGKVGIGLSAPGRELSLYASTNPAIQIVNSDSGVGSGDGFKIQLGAVTADDVSIINQESSGSMFFGVNDSIDMTILDGGNVGIGSTDPKGPLHVKCNTNNYGLTLEDSDVGSNETFSLKMDGGGHLQFEAGTADDLASKGTFMTIKDDGTVGIGATSPDRKLHINSGSTNECVLFESTNTEVALELKDSTGTAIIKSRHDFRFEAGDEERVRIDSAGKVGIGDTSPGEMLVVGDVTKDQNTYIRVQADTDNEVGIKFMEETTNKWQFYVDGDDGDKFNLYDESDTSTAVHLVQGGNSWVSDSDERIKKDIANIGSVLESINQLRPVTYKKKYGKADNTLPGLIAQEVNPHFPLVVSGDENDFEEIDPKDGKTAQYKGAMGVDYTSLIPYLIKAVQELTAKVEALENK